MTSVGQDDLPRFPARSRRSTREIDTGSTGESEAGPSTEYSSELTDDQGRMALTDFCLAIANLAGRNVAVGDAEDIMFSLTAILQSSADGVAASSATAVAGLLVPVQEHSTRHDREAVEVLAAAHQKTLRGFVDNQGRTRELTQAEKAKMLHRRNPGPDMRSAALARERFGAPKWHNQSERRTLQNRLLTARGIEPLVGLVGSKHPASRCAGAHALRNASDHNEEACDAIREAGGLSLLHTVLTRLTDDTEGAEEANMSAWEKRALRQAMGAEAVEEAEATHFWALGTLGNMAHSNDANREAIHELNVIPLLVNITTDAGAQAQATIQTGAQAAQQQARARADQAEARALQLEAKAQTLRRAAEVEARSSQAAGRGFRMTPKTAAASATATAEAQAARAEAQAAMVEARSAAQAAKAATETLEKQKTSSSAHEEEQTGLGKELAILAGEVLSSLLAKGDKRIEMAIVSGIVDAVKTQGAQAPVAFPELMTVLQAAARERLKKAQEGTDSAALSLSLAFGRWIQLPTILLGQARNHFRIAQLQRTADHENALRRQEIGLLSPDRGDAEDYHQFGLLAEDEDDIDGLPRTPGLGPGTGSPIDSIGRGLADTKSGESLGPPGSGKEDPRNRRKGGKLLSPTQSTVQRERQFKADRAHLSQHQPSPVPFPSQPQASPPAAARPVRKLKLSPSPTKSPTLSPSQRSQRPSQRSQRGTNASTSPPTALQQLQQRRLQQTAADPTSSRTRAKDASQLSTRSSTRGGKVGMKPSKNGLSRTRSSLRAPALPSLAEEDESDDSGERHETRMHDEPAALIPTKLKGRRARSAAAPAAATSPSAAAAFVQV